MAEELKGHRPELPADQGAGVFVEAGSDVGGAVGRRRAHHAALSAGVGNF